MNQTPDESAIARPLRVFVADDDRELRRMIAMALRRDGHIVLEAKDDAALLQDLSQVFRGPNPDTSDAVVICGVQRSGKDGLSVMRSMRQYPWCPPFILMTAFADDEFRTRAWRLGAHAIFGKPFDLDTLLATVGSMAAGPTMTSV